MKKLILSVVAAAIAVSPVAISAAEAAPQHRTVTTVKQRPGRTVVKQRTVVRQPRYVQQTRQWHRGERFDHRYARNYRQIDYRQYRGLRAPPRGYRYVQAGNDAVLVGIATGLIAAVFAGAIH